MKLKLFILFSILSIKAFALDESEFLKSVDKAIHTDFEKADSLIHTYKELVTEFSEQGKFQFLLYYLIHQSTKHNGDSIPFDSYLTDLGISEEDKKLLNLVKVFAFDEDHSIRRTKLKEIELSIKDDYSTSNKKALFKVFKGYSQDIERSDKYFDKALMYARKSRAPILPAFIFQVIATKHRELGRYKEAVEFHQKALDYSRNKNHTLSILRQSLMIAEIQVEMENLQKAKRFFLISSSLSKEIGHDLYLSISLRGLGIIELLSNSYASGVKHFQEALVLYYKMSSDLGIAQTHKDLGKAYLMSKEYKLSENNFDLSQTYYRKIAPPKKGEVDLYVNFALLKFEQKKYNEALVLINNVVNNLSAKSDKNLELFEAYEVRSKIYAALGNGQKAYEDLLIAKNYRDSIYNANLRQQIAELSELYETEEKSKRILDQDQKLKEAKNERLLREQQLENIQLRNSQIIIIFSFSTLLLLAILMIFYFKSKQRQLKLQQTETELRQQLLRSQMNPHFVFNAMSVIQSYIYDNNTEKSSQFLVSLSRLMRLILENSSKESIKLNTEIEILERFLFIQQERFENRFEFEIEKNTSIDLEKIAIPPMILQPFVENATEHGELEKVLNGKIRIAYRIENQLIIFVVEDNGIGRKAALANVNKRSKDHKSMAISITEKRIDLLRLKYNVEGYVKIEDLEGEGVSGTRVTVAMPLLDNT